MVWIRSASSWRIRGHRRLFPVAEKLAETVKLFGGDAVAAVGDIVMKFL